MDHGVAEYARELHTEMTKAEVEETATSSSHIDSEIDVNRIKEEPGLVQFVKNELVLLAEDEVLENCGEDPQPGNKETPPQQQAQSQLYTCDECPKVFKYKASFNVHRKYEHSIESHKCAEQETTKAGTAGQEGVPAMPTRATETVAAISTSFAADRVELGQLLHMKEQLEDTGLDIGPTLFQNMDSHYKTNQETGLNEIKKEIKILNFDLEKVICGFDDGQSACSQLSDETIESSRKNSSIKQVHDSEENKSNGYRCEKCLKVYKSKGIRNTHVNQVHATESHKCTQCDKEFNCKKYLSLHKQNKHSKVQYECDTCKVKYKSLKALRYHISSSYRRRLAGLSSEGYSCDKCQKVFKSEISLNQHIKQLHGIESYKCTWCNKEFKCRPYLLKHIKYSHGEEQGTELYKCTQCNKGFKCKPYYLKHVAKYHHHRSAASSSQQSLSTVPIVSSVAACSLVQSCGLTIKQELEDSDLDIGPTVFQHMDSHYRTEQVKVEQVKVENSPLTNEQIVKNETDLSTTEHVNLH